MKLHRSNLCSLIGILLAAAACSSAASAPGQSDDAMTPAVDGGSVPYQGATCGGGHGECRCENTPFALDDGERPLSSCGAGSLSPALDWLCGYDLNSAGESTSCYCTPYQCAVDPNADGRCVCGFGIAGGGPSTASCNELLGVTEGPLTCCAHERPLGVAPGGVEYPGDVFTCECVVGTGTCGEGSISVPSCDATLPLVAPAYPFETARTCDALKWAPPPQAAAKTPDEDPCPSGCAGCARCAPGGCVDCPIGELGICTC